MCCGDARIRWWIRGRNRLRLLRRGWGLGSDFRRFGFLPLRLRFFKRVHAVVEVLHLAKQVLLHGFDFLQALLHLWIAVDVRSRLRITG